MNKKTLKKLDSWLQEVHFFEQCNVQEGEKCKHPHCRYSIITLGNNSCTFTCGRTYIEYNKLNKNNTIILKEGNDNEQ